MSLVDLPVELLDEICLHLPYTSLVALRWTCRVLYYDVYSPLPTWWKITQIAHDPEAMRKARDDRYPFHTLDGKIDLDLARPRGPNHERTRPPSPEELRRCMFDLLIMESWPCFNTSTTSRMDHISAGMRNKIIPHDMYGCHFCLRLRPQSAFAIAQTRGDRTRARYPVKTLLERQAKVAYYVAGLSIEERYCLECGTKHGKYQKGSMLQFIEEEDVKNGAKKLVIATGIVCKRCGEFKRAGAETKAALRRLCNDCLVYRPI